MRPALSLKTLLRSPLKTIFTFLLIAAASFAIFSRVTDYVITTRETEHAVGFYNGVAALDTTVPDTNMTAEGDGFIAYDTIENENKPWPTDEQIERFSSLPGVTLADTRYMTAGLVEDYKRMTGTDSIINDYETFVLEGTYIGYDYDEVTNQMGLLLSDVKLLAGDIELDLKEPTIVKGMAAEDLIYFINPFHLGFFEELDKGGRYLVIGTYDTESGKDLYLAIGEGAFIDLDGLPDNYLETDEFASDRDLIEAINQGIYSYDIVYTSDMRSIPHFNEREMIMTEGRLLMPGDTEACVVSALFMQAHELTIGDIIKIELGDKLFTQDGVNGARDEDSSSISGFIKTVELEIVGSYSHINTELMRMRERPWSYTPNTIFVPVSLLPVEIPADYEISMGEFSVLIENARDIETFLEEAKSLIEEMDIALRFSDGGWMSIKDSFETGSLTAFLTTTLYLTGAALALLLAVYLYIGRSRVTYAIMRALGVPGEKARNSIMLPLGVLSAFAIPVGGIAGLVYTSSVVTEALESMMSASPDGYIPDTSLPVGVILLCLLCVLIFITATTSLFLWKMRKTPPLELLQGDVIKVTVSAGAMSAAAGVLTEDPELKIIQLPVTHAGVSQRRKYSALRQVTAYIFRHMRRGLGKTAISLTLAVVLTTGVGLLVLTKMTYQDAFRDVDVIGRTYGFSSSSIRALSNTEIISDFFYYGSFGVLINGMDFQNTITITNNRERYFEDARISNYHIEYADRFDSSSVGDTLCLLGSAIAEIHGVGPGDKITLLSSNSYFALTKIYEDSEEDILAAAVERESKSYRVMGIVYSDDLSINSGVFASVSKVADQVYGQPFPLDFSEFTLMDNERLSDLSDLLSRQISINRRYAPEATFYLDAAELDNIRYVRDLIILLFPIAVTAAVLIGSAAPGLIIVQSAKVAALMRILGVTKKRTRCMLMFEQIGLCVIGIALVTGALALYNSGLFARSAETLAISGALYLSGCFCAAFWASVHVTRRRVLELIQVKE